MDSEFDPAVWDGQAQAGKKPGKRGKPDPEIAALREHQQLQVEFARAVARAEQQAHQTHTLFTLSQGISVAMELDELRQAIVDSLYDALRADTASLFQQDPDGALRMVAQRNIDLTRARIIFGPEEGLVALAARESRVIHVPDTGANAFYLPTGHDQPRSLLAVPVEPESGANYVLCVVRRRVYAFTDDEVQYAHLLASVAAHTLSNAALYSQMRLLAREQTTLYDLARASTNSDGATSYIGRATEPLRRALNANGCAILMVPDDDAGNSGRIQTSSHGVSDFGLERCEAFVEEIAASGTARHVAIRCDVSPDGSRIILAPVLLRDTPVAVVAWEIHVGPERKHAAPATEVWNATHHLTSQTNDLVTPPVQSAAPPPITEEEATFITSVCQQLALGMENLRLRAQDLSALRSISALPASRTHLDRLRQSIAHEVANAFAPAGVALILRDDHPDGPTGQPHLSAHTPHLSPSWLRAALQYAANDASAELRQHRGVALAPLLVDHDILGWLALHLPTNARLSADRALLLTSLAGTSALLLRNARLHLVAREAAVDRERQRIAREIHDGVAQNLAHLMLRLELIQRLIPANPIKAQAEAEASRQVLFRSLNDLRHSIAAMAPAQLEELGFVGAVQALLDDVATNTPSLHVTFTSCPDDAIPAELRPTAFRVVQEALANIRKHAQAEHAWITVELTPAAALRLIVRDDGQGFTLAHVPGPAKGHFGMNGMRERAEEFGGQLRIDSKPGHGTTIELDLPLALAA